MRRRFHRHRHEETELNITAFLNLMVILVPFLLVTAVFTRITIIDLKIPQANDSPASKSAPKEIPEVINIIVRTNVISVTTNKAGIIQQYPRQATGFDFKAISELLQTMKDADPNRNSANLLIEAEVSYETVVATMDTMRMFEVKDGDTRVKMELFPDISLGDAPAAAQ